MAESVHSELQRISVKCRMLVDRYESREAELKLLRQRVTELEAYIKQLRGEVEALRRESRYLKAAAAIDGDTSGDKGTARAMLLEILRDIDKCIEQLTY